MVEEGHVYRNQAGKEAKVTGVFPRYVDGEPVVYVEFQYFMAPGLTDGWPTWRPLHVFERDFDRA